jgi:hypothetical protein
MRLTIEPRLGVVLVFWTFAILSDSAVQVRVPSNNGLQNDASANGGRLKPSVIAHLLP